MRRYTLSKGLFTAREARYRNIPEQFKQTMKQFFNMDLHLSQLRHFLDTVKWQINKDYEDITAYAMLVYEDCKRSRDMLKRASLVINSEVCMCVRAHVHMRARFCACLLARVSEREREVARDISPILPNHQQITKNCADVDSTFANIYPEHCLLEKHIWHLYGTSSRLNILVPVAFLQVFKPLEDFKAKLLTLLVTQA